jgi:hypothetical protein
LQRQSPKPFAGTTTAAATGRRAVLAGDIYIYIYIYPICVPVTDVGYVRNFCSGEVISRRFGTLIALDRGMQIMFTETVLSKMFSLRPK